MTGDGKKAAVVIGAGVGLAALTMVALYKHGVEFYLFRTPQQAIVDEQFTVSLGITNRSNTTRDGFIEEGIDGDIHDAWQLTLAPGESWELTFETGFAFHEEGMHELCYCVDTFNPDLKGRPWFLQAPQSVCRKIEAK